MLNILKLFSESQGKYLLNKEKYKPLLYILTKIDDNNGRLIKIERIEELLKRDDMENVIFTENEINEEEYKNLENLEVNEKLFKNIETALMNRINYFFQQENIVTKKILTERDFNLEDEQNQNEVDDNKINTKEDNNEDDLKEK